MKTQLYRVLAKSPVMGRSMMVDASKGVLVNRKLHASIFTEAQAKKYIEDAKANGYSDWEFKVVEF